MAATARPRRKYVLRLAALSGVLAFAAAVDPAPAQAQVGSDRYSSIVVDAATGNVLEAANPDALRHPASLAKLMTLYMAFEALRDRRITAEEMVPVSGHAAAMEPSKLGLVPGTRLTVEEAILGLVTKSANDAAAALGELLGGSEDRFAQMMTLRARALGMSHTTFTNASGLPDPDQWTTARDLAILARHLLSDFPGFYPYFSTRSFTFQRRVIFNHDRMLQSYPGADGMKTGYTEASGHNLVTSAVHSGVRLIGVVLGAASNPERDAHMAMLLNQGFDELDVAPERRTTVASRLPSLVSTAHAATLVEQPAHQAARGHVPSPPATGWSIQVGSFATERAARDAAANARRLADGGEVRVEPTSQRGRTGWRAQVTGLSASEAQNACSTLARRKTACMVLRPDQRQVASR
ncbi:MAG TPA: D-alanyl-D-alanine carboxypeptidase family protein [Acetobacteraceae bacterium]|jgi:D-alanyl-D-alanine carboxypeptidase|nr:D-alanyl-D-alanine carboxypeptidase family protein [Acetobacteraceae bacterium]